MVSLGEVYGTLGRDGPAPQGLLPPESPTLAAPDHGLVSAPTDHSPASQETHPLVRSNVLAADHHPSQCQEAVAQVADLEGEHRR